MIKLRLHGEAAEIKELVEHIKHSPRIKVKSCSEPYKDRGQSVYERVYMDVDYAPIATAKPEFEALFAGSSEACDKSPSPALWEELMRLTDRIESTDLSERPENYDEYKEQALQKLDEARIILKNLDL